MNPIVHRALRLGLLLLLLLWAAPAHAEEGLAVSLEPAPEGAQHAPRYSPKGMRVALTPRPAGTLAHLLGGHDHRAGRIELGLAGAGHAVVVARAREGGPYSLLWIDTEGDGAMDPDAPLRAESRVSRGNTWTSFATTLQVRHADGREPYRINLWIVVPDPAEPPAFVRFSRRTFLHGRVTMDDAPHTVVLSDADNDGLYGEGDWWALLPADGSVPHDIAHARKVGDFTWVGERAWKLQLDDTRGRGGRLVPFDPGLTPQEDARARDPYAEDREAPRAEVPLAFRHDVEAALLEARAQQRSVFLDFETSWCGPCKQMDRWVYTAAPVVEAARGLVCVKADGDAEKALVARYEVKGYPTGLLLAPDGTVTARFSGYRGVEAMVAFLARAAPSAPGPRGALLMAGPAAVANLHADLLEAFVAAHPAVRATFEADGSASPDTLLLMGQVDLLVRVGPFTPVERERFLERHGCLPVRLPAFLGKDGTRYDLRVLVYEPGDLPAVHAAFLAFLWSPEATPSLEKAGFAPLPAAERAAARIRLAALARR